MVVAAERVAAFSFVRRPSHPALVFGSLKLMSALGHKRTFAVQTVMSALAPKADIPEAVELAVALLPLAFGSAAVSSRANH